MEKYLRQVMTNEEMDLALSWIAREIIQDHASLDQSAIVRSRRRGVPLAEMFHEKLPAQVDRSVDCGGLESTFYRNDFSLVQSSPSYAGRTIQVALENIQASGRSRKVNLWS